MIRVEEVRGRKGLKKFVEFQIDLYKGNPYFVPPIVSMEVDNFDIEQNPSMQVGDMIFFMAYNEDEKPVGRIAGIINHRYNKKAGTRLCRFGYVDFIDDKAVSKALFDAVVKWARFQGMTTLAGPLGMTDFDKEGALIEGFDQKQTFNTIYNHAYYIDHFKAYGLAMEEDTVWLEYFFPMPDKLDEKHLAVAEFVKSHYGLKASLLKDTKDIKKNYGPKIFDLLNEAYAHLDYVSELDRSQIDYFIDYWLKLVPLDLVAIVTDQDDNLVSFGITCPSLAEAQQKAKGSLFPFGWYHMLKGLYFKGGSDIWDLMLIAVSPKYQGKGVSTLLFTTLFGSGKKRRFKWVSAYPQLEKNIGVHAHWKVFGAKVNRRRATFKKFI